MTKSKALDEIMKIEENFVEQSVIEHINWETSPFFDLKEGYAVRGEQEKLAVRCPERIYTGQPKKCLWFFWNVKPFNNTIQIVAVKKGTRVRAKALTDQTSSKYWSVGEAGSPLYGADATMVSLISLPASGLWSLNVFNGDQYIGDIVVEVEKHEYK